MPGVNGLVTTTQLNTKTSEVKNKIPICTLHINTSYEYCVNKF